MTLNLDTVARELGITHNKSKNDEENYFCPVHDGETADLNISNGDKFICHPSGEGGKSPVTLVMHAKEMNKAEAVEWLSENFPSEFGNMDEETITRRKQAREVMDFVTTQAHKCLMQRRGQLKADFKEERNLTDEDIEEYQLGFFHHDIKDSALNKFDEQALLDSGLFGKNDGEIYSHLAGRLVFPYINGGRTVFMAGRRTSENQKGKYKKAYNTDYNTHTLYKFTENNSKAAIITEGFTDAISADKAGFDTFSPATVQFQDDDIQQIVEKVKEYNKVYIINDGDEAGQDGAMKTADLLTENESEPVIVPMSEGQDLDDWTTNNGYNLSAKLDEGQYFLDDLLDTVTNGDRHSRPEAKQKIFKLISDWSETRRNEVLRDIPGSLETVKDEYEDATQGSETSQTAPSTPPDSKYDSGKGNTVQLADDHDPSELYMSENGGFKANKLAEDIENDYHFIYSELEEKMYVYKNGVYEDAERTIKEECNQRLGDQFRKSYVSDTKAAIETRPGVAKNQRQMRPPTHLINFKNGVYNLENGELQEHSPEHHFTQQIPWNYNPDASTEHIDSFLNDITGNNKDAETLYEMAGYTMMTSMPIEHAFMLIGQGSNGKTMFLNTLKKMLGEQNAKDETLQQLENGRFATRHLYRKLMVVSDDLPSEKLSKGGTLKALTGGGSVRAEIKGGDSFEFKNYATPVFAANEIPPTEDQSDGFFRRWTIVDFPNRFVHNPDPDNPRELQAKPPMKLKNNLHSEETMQAFATKAAQSMKKVYNNNQFTHQSTPEETRQKWNSYADPILEFLNKFVDQGVTKNEAERRSNSSDGQMDMTSYDFDYITKSELHQLITAYCESRSHRPPLMQNLTKKMNKDTELFFTSTDSRVPSEDSGRVKIYRGIQYSDDFKTLLAEANDRKELNHLLGTDSTDHKLPGSIQDKINSHTDDDEPRDDIDKAFTQLAEMGDDQTVQYNDLIQFMNKDDKKVTQIIDHKLDTGEWYEPTAGKLAEL